MPGDSKAELVEAFQRLHPRLVAMINRRTSDKMAAWIDPEGVVQDAIIHAGPGWQAFTPKSRELNAWVYREVYHRFLDAVRAARGPTRDVDRNVAWVEYLINSHTGPNTALSRAELREVVHAAMEKLKPLDREILEFRYFDDLNYEEIGMILNLKANTATARASRALGKLCQLIPPAFRPPGASQP